VGLVAAGFSIERNGKDRLVRPILWNKKKGVSFMRNAFANLKQKAPRAGFEPATYRREDCFQAVYSYMSNQFNLSFSASNL
jgi:hypothetical protein